MLQLHEKNLEVLMVSYKRNNQKGMRWNEIWNNANTIFRENMGWTAYAHSKKQD